MLTAALPARGLRTRRRQTGAELLDTRTMTKHGRLRFCHESLRRSLCVSFALSIAPGAKIADCTAAVGQCDPDRHTLS
jgi:hypothetical protein